MEERMTREQFLERIFNKSYDELKGKKLRLTRLNVPAREINFAHVIGVAADVAMKSGNVTIGFLDRFRGTVIVLGDLPNVRSAIEGAVDFFKYQLHFTVCDVTEE